MAKAQGIIGNFKGKIGNTVGYKLTSSNNKQTQGIRIYQPNVKNPKTSAQAEQRAKLAPINATYRALKMIIDRGIEGLPYGNKSRLAWLKQAFKTEKMPWYEKGSVVKFPVGCQLTKGSLASLTKDIAADSLKIFCQGLTADATTATVGAVSTAIMTGNTFLQEGDQITILYFMGVAPVLSPVVFSFVLSPTDKTPISGFSAEADHLVLESTDPISATAIIVSREGANGEHLRSNEVLVISNDYVTDAPYDADSKTAAIKSYMASGDANTDWEQEPID